MSGSSNNFNGMQRKSTAGVMGFFAFGCGCHFGTVEGLKPFFTERRGAKMKAPTPVSRGENTRLCVEDGVNPKTQNAQHTTMMELLTILMKLLTILMELSTIVMELFIVLTEVLTVLMELFTRNHGIIDHT